MFSGKSKSKLVGALLAASLMTVPSAAFAGVIVKSSGPSAKTYPVGTKLDDDATITLKDGDTITVLTSEGTRVMKGAGSYRVGENPTETRTRFAALTRKRAARRVRTGAVRTGEEGGPKTNPNIWLVDVAAGGTICHYDLSRVRLWRSSSEAISTYTVAEASGDASIDVTFDEGSSIAAVDPARMTLVEGHSYAINGPGENAGVTVTFAGLSEDYASADMLAEKLIEKGCNVQVELLADQLEAAAE